MTRVVHVLPHRGGGAETYLDILGVPQEDRLAMAGARTALAAAPSMPIGLARAARAAGAADVVHAHGDMAAVLALPILRRYPSVWTTHGLHMLRRRPAIRHAVQAVVSATAQTLCTSAAERDELAALLPATLQDRLVVARNGIDLPEQPTAEARVAARAGLDVGAGALVALFLGQLEARKAPLVAVEAALRAREAGANVLLLVAGEGPEADALAQAQGEGEGIRALGFRDDVDTLLAAADVLVLPSEREGLSFAILEAMGRGVPVLASDGPGNPEAVGDGGVIVPAGDAVALGEALAALAADPAERARLGERARARIAEVLTADALRAAVDAAYRAALVG